MLSTFKAAVVALCVGPRLTRNARYIMICILSQRVCKLRMAEACRTHIKCQRGYGSCRMTRKRLCFDEQNLMGPNLSSVIYYAHVDRNETS